MSTTITIKRKIKRLLEKLRGEMAWNEFLWKMALEEHRRRALKALERIRKTKENRDFNLEESKMRLNLK